MMMAASRLHGQSRDSGDPLIIAARAKFASLAPPHSYSPKVALLNQGAPVEQVYFIDRGLIKLVHIEAGGEQMIVDLRFPGWILGAAEAIVQEPSSVTALTLTTCRLHCLQTKEFQALLASDQQFSHYLHQMHGREVIRQPGRIAQLGCIPAQQRLEQLLWHLFSELKPPARQDKVCLKMPLKHWEIAELIAVTPQYLSSLIKQLERHGLLQREKGCFIILQPEKLWHQSGS
jgi:CRP-like cAMP-binding protein